MLLVTLLGWIAGILTVLVLAFWSDAGERKRRG